VIEEIKMSLLAKSCISPGVIALIANLITTTNDSDLENYE